MVLAPDKVHCELGMPPPLPSPSRGRRWQYALIGLLTMVGLVIGVMATGVVRYELRSHPGAKSVSSAVSSFRHSGSSSLDPLHAVPAAGVYTLRGQGGERISFPPNSQKDGATMPATVTHLSNGCWRWHLDYNAAHAEEYVFCPTEAGLTQSTNVNIQHWDYGAFKVSNIAIMTCPAGSVVLPSAPSTGQKLTWSCSETSTAISGLSQSTTKAHIVGVEPLRIGSATVETAHEVQETTLSGTQTGTVTENWWFDVTNGLPVRIDREIMVHTASPLGAITYTESGSWQMASLTPHT